jgi:hypothetical protein
MCIFWAMVAIRGWVADGTDAINAFAQAAPAKDPTHVHIDHQMMEWMEETQGRIPNHTKVLHIICAL